MGCRRYASYFVSPIRSHSLAIPRHPMPPPCPHASLLVLSHLIPSFCCTLACTSWLLFHPRLLHDIKGNNEMADGERGGQSVQCYIKDHKGHLGRSSRAPEPPSSIPLVSR
ncbi:hypothetical protein BT69DRAFT_1280576 [Atractiella rhizophila]|nr:hypothetical protein BT69DRAFT_1280576 [Atractiella rhizophila]